MNSYLTFKTLNISKVIIKIDISFKWHILNFIIGFIKYDKVMASVSLCK